jgi:hypothetical protein
MDPTPYAASVAGPVADGYKAEDVEGALNFAHSLGIDLSAKTISLDGSPAKAIADDGATGLAGVTVKKSAAGIAISSTYAEPIAYRLKGSLTGTLSVEKSAAPYKLILEGAAIQAVDGPALSLTAKAKAFIYSAAGTSNELSDSAKRSANKDKAAVYAKGPIVFQGRGSLSVTASYKHGVFSEDYIRVTGGTISVSVSAKNALQAVNAFIFDDGRLSISATGTVIDEESKGIKVDGAEGSGAGLGYIIINGGYIDIVSVGKAITAGWDIDEDAKTADRSDDPDPDLRVNAGVITVKTTGQPYERIDSATGKEVSLSPEGLEAKSDLIIKGGYLKIETTDDSLNAGNSVSIKGGLMYCASESNDAIDSNGGLAISGGTIVAIAAGGPESAFDCDANTFNISGGTFVGIGGSTSVPTASACSQNVLVLNGLGLKSGQALALRSGFGEIALAYKMARDADTIIVSSPAITTGAEYAVMAGGGAASGDSFMGLSLGKASYSGGNALKTLKVSSRLTSLGSMQRMPNRK